MINKILLFLEEGTEPVVKNVSRYWPWNWGDGFTIGEVAGFFGIAFCVIAGVILLCKIIRAFRGGKK